MGGGWSVGRSDTPLGNPCFQVSPCVSLPRPPPPGLQVSSEPCHLNAHPPAFWATSNTFPLRTPGDFSG